MIYFDLSKLTNTALELNALTDIEMGGVDPMMQEQPFESENESNWHLPSFEATLHNAI